MATKTEYKKHAPYMGRRAIIATKYATSLVVTWFL